MVCNHQAAPTLCIRLTPEVATANGNSSLPYRSLFSDLWNSSRQGLKRKYAKKSWKLAN
ncbi:17325_t:CDS:2 [Dentiscutata erythropus]|uniref:17325_t:CDS:1 n=1 Tax=Dentiscutata erythropus TaxID=1348616 RepID=A0A9N9HLS7_9GLOM|nr:17325_t:CDS:2 [Dentiscutata erythropus]